MGGMGQEQTTEQKPRGLGSLVSPKFFHYNGQQSRPGLGANIRSATKSIGPSHGLGGLHAIGLRR